MSIKTTVCCFCSVVFTYNDKSKHGKYCSNACQQQLQKQKRIETWLATGKHPGKKTLKEYLINHHGYKCSCCGISKWNQKPLNLEIDHIDGNPYNNLVSNLRFICPNCHSQTSTYKAKNKGNGRVERRQRALNDYYRAASIAELVNAPAL